MSTCYALAPWVRATATSGLQGLEERRWEGLIGQPEEVLKSQAASVAGSRIGSRVASRTASQEDLLGAGMSG